ncbi:hypothetical protein EW145_g5303 [Phellinidium pouzarii]|uniref:Uncharacterized protein n=1 Tax=Phellinidium pouzarii TaxID=167371 RepID=A0A4S4L0E3_9AGAM|nr:hypothetical protein EW145_g5303 [Phellinidium pouzarii]
MSVFYHTTPPVSPARTYFPTSSRHGSSYGYFGTPTVPEYARPYNEYTSPRSPGSYYAPTVNGNGVYYQLTSTNSTVDDIARVHITTTAAIEAKTAVGAAEEGEVGAGAAAVMTGGMIHVHMFTGKTMDAVGAMGIGGKSGWLHMSMIMRAKETADLFSKGLVTAIIMVDGDTGGRTTAACATDRIFLTFRVLRACLRAHFLGKII